MKLWSALVIVLLLDVVGVLISAWPGEAPAFSTRPASISAAAAGGAATAGRRSTAQLPAKASPPARATLPPPRQTPAASLPAAVRPRPATLTSRHAARHPVP